MPENGSGELRPKIALVNVSGAVKSTAIDRAEEKLAAEQKDLKGIKGFWNKFWKYGFFGEYNRQKGIREEEAKIKEEGSLYDSKQIHDEAMKAVVGRFVSDYNEVIHEGAGEIRENASDEVRRKVVDLVKDFVADSVDEDGFKEREKQLFKEMSGPQKGRRGGEAMFASNMLDVARQMKQQLEHGLSLEELDAQLEVVTGRAKLGARTEAHYNAIDRITDKVMRTRVGSLVNETTVASTLSIVYGVGQQAVQSFARSTAAKAASFGGTAVVAAGVAGAKEGYKLETERKQHSRDMAKGKQINPEDNRRLELEKYQYSTVRATALIEGLQNGIQKLRSGTTSEDDLRDVLGIIAETYARVSLSDERGIDLISYESEGKIESDRAELDKARAEARRLAQNALNLDQYADVRGERSSDNFIDVAIATQKETIVKGAGGIDEKDKGFRGLKRKRVAGAAFRGLVTGLAVGGVAQEVGAFFNENQQGLVETLVKGKNAVATGAEHMTALEALRSYISGDWKKTIGFETETVGGIDFRVPEGTDVIKEADGTFSLTGGKNNEEIVSGIKFDSSGGLTPESEELLSSHGAVVTKIPRQVTREVWREVERRVGAEEFIEGNDVFGDVEVEKYFMNGTLKSEANELRLWWGGESLDGGETFTGIDSRGNFVMDVSRMTAGGSFTFDEAGNKIVGDPARLIRDGKMFLALNLTEGTRGKVVEVAIDTTGKAVIPADSEIGKLFFEAVDGKAVFRGDLARVACEVGAKGGVEKLHVFATHAGEGIAETGLTVTDRLRETVVDQVVDWSVSLPAPEQKFDDYLVDMPPVIPIIFRTPLMKAERVTTDMPPAAPEAARREPAPRPGPARGPDVPPIPDAGDDVVEGEFRPEGVPLLEAPNSVPLLEAPEPDQRQQQPPSDEELNPWGDGSTQEVTEGLGLEDESPWEDPYKIKELPVTDEYEESEELDENKAIVFPGAKVGDNGVLELHTVRGDSLKQDIFEIEEVVNGGQSYVAKAKFVNETNGGPSEVALRYSSKAAGVDADYRKVYEGLSEEAKKSMPRSYGIRRSPVDAKEYVVQEWVNGRSLRSELEGGMPMRERDIGTIFNSMGRLILELHTKFGLIHRDVKPDNIIIERDSSGEVSRVVLTDWDLLIRAQGKNLFPEGTDGYAAFDQYTREELWSVTDEHALGMTLYELFTGEDVNGKIDNVTGRIDKKRVMEDKKIPDVWRSIIVGLTSLDKRKRWSIRGRWDI